MQHTDPTLGAARAALQRYEFSHAIALFDAYLQAHPEDLEAELERGLAHLMAGDEARFAEVHDRMAPRMRAWPPRAGRLQALWQAYDRAVRKLARAAAIVALSTLPLGLAGCPKDAHTTPPDRHPPARSVDAGTTAPPADVDAGAPSAPDAGPDATTARPGPDASSGVTPVVRPPVNIRPKYGVRLRYRVVRPHYRYGIRKPRTP